ncbi:hypothetical protein BHE74_00050313 [Ensete ventricosum]|nr:hypothetical protein BHE74_00050313 [Ensete ventricosum]
MIPSPSERGPSRIRVTPCTHRSPSSVGPPEEPPWIESNSVARSPSRILEPSHSGVGPLSRPAVLEDRRAAFPGWPIPTETFPAPPLMTPDDYLLLRARSEGARLSIKLRRLGPRSQPPHLGFPPPSNLGVPGAGGTSSYPGK